MRKICMSYLKRKMGITQTMNKMELPMSIFVSATSREDSVPDDDSDLQAARVSESEGGDNGRDSHHHHHHSGETHPVTP